MLPRPEQGIEAGEIDPDIDAEQFAVQFCAFIFGTIMLRLAARAHSADVSIPGT